MTKNGYHTILVAIKNQRPNDVAFFTVTKMTENQRQIDVAFLTSLKRLEWLPYNFGLSLEYQKSTSKQR